MIDPQYEDEQVSTLELAALRDTAVRAAVTEAKAAPVDREQIVIEHREHK
jgi:hypothetical protein